MTLALPQHCLDNITTLITEILPKQCMSKHKMEKISRHPAPHHAGLIWCKAPVLNIAACTDRYNRTTRPPYIACKSSFEGLATTRNTGNTQSSTYPHHGSTNTEIHRRNGRVGSRPWGFLDNTHHKRLVAHPAPSASL